MRILFSALLCVALTCVAFTACSNSKNIVKKSNDTAEAPKAPALRLSEYVKPTKYAAELRMNPTEGVFQGVAEIDVELERNTNIIWLNADELTISKAVARIGGEALQAKIWAQPRTFVGLQFEKPIPTGKGHLHIEYSGKVSDKDFNGATRQKDGDDWYIFTHFEPNDARRVFPSFDEPSFKIPWKISIVVPAGNLAFSNAPLANEKEIENGMKRFEFAETKPLPSYLIALAIGPFEIVEAGQSQRSQAPIRILTPKGRKAEARWAAEISAPILARLEEYFDAPYPYEKLDCVAVPQGSGAMEHPGLVTYAMRGILSKPEAETIQFKRGYASVAAHEFAHQWFGDLVTMAWWDDLWLNEAFATWLGPKIIEQLQPTWNENENSLLFRGYAMQADSLVSARKIRQPIESEHDMKNAFDSITYQKGSAVISMFERWAGEDNFRKGVQVYMRAHAHSNATAADFLKAISDAAEKDVATPFSTFLDQPGVPLITAEVQCGNDGQKIELSQERYLPLGSEGSTASTWQIPICMRWRTGPDRELNCQLLKEAKETFALPKAKKCPDWVLVNDRSSSYVRVRYKGDALKNLSTKAGSFLSVRERMTLMADTVAASRAGKVTYDEVLTLVPQLAKDSNRFITFSALNAVSWLRDEGMISAAAQPQYAKFIRDHFGKRAQALGWAAKKSDDDDTRLVRQRLVPVVANQGEDELLGKEASRLAQEWLKNHNSVDPDMVNSILEVAVSRGDKKLFDQMVEAAVAEKDATEREHIFRSLRAFRDPALTVEVLNLMFDERFDIRETRFLTFAGTTASTRLAAYDFVKKNFDRLVARMPRDSASSFPFVGAQTCDESLQNDVREFFAEKAPRYAGGPRNLSQALESMRLCVAEKKAQAETIEKFFSPTSAKKPARPKNNAS